MSVKTGILGLTFIFAMAALSPLVLGPRARAEEIIVRQASVDAKVNSAATRADAHDREFWSFRPCKRPDVPALDTNAWVKTPVDSFLLSKMQAAGFTPAPPASRTTLLRRVYYGLIGL